MRNKITTAGSRQQAYSRGDQNGYCTQAKRAALINSKHPASFRVIGYVDAYAADRNDEHVHMAFVLERIANAPAF
jgi:hypothetical protein